LFSPTLLLSNFLTCTYFNAHIIFNYIISFACNPNTLYSFTLLILVSLKLKEFNIPILDKLGHAIIITSTIYFDMGRVNKFVNNANSMMSIKASCCFFIHMNVKEFKSKIHLMKF